MTKLDKLVNSISKNHIYIQTHNFPDPDAISSAFALQNLLKTRNISSTICYTGKIDRYSTVQMIKDLKIEIINVNDLDCMNEDDEIILVDSQKGNINVKDITGKAIICIDHHPMTEGGNYIYKDIRSNVGACVSIIAEYYFENNIEIPENVATAIIYGIKIDTASLMRGVSQLDLDIFYKTYNLCNKAILNDLEHSVLQLDDLKVYANVFNSIKIIDGISFANTGKNCPEALIATISDFLMSISDVKISIVYSIKNDGIKLSVRSKSKALDAGKIVSNALKGMGDGGGHAHMAGGFVPFGNDERTDNELISLIETGFIKELADI